MYMNSDLIYQINTNKNMKCQSGKPDFRNTNQLFF